MLLCMLLPSIFLLYGLSLCVVYTLYLAAVWLLIIFIDSIYIPQKLREKELFSYIIRSLNKINLMDEHLKSKPSATEHTYSITSAAGWIALEKNFENVY